MKARCTACVFGLADEGAFAADFAGLVEGGG